jgi:hypothetical protein
LVCWSMGGWMDGWVLWLLVGVYAIGSIAFVVVIVVHRPWIDSATRKSHETNETNTPRLVNMELLQTYAPDVWLLYNEELERFKGRLDKELEALRKEADMVRCAFCPYIGGMRWEFWGVEVMPRAWRGIWGVFD